MKTIFLSYTRELLHPGQFLFNCNHFISVNCRIVITTIRRVISATAEITILLLIAEWSKNRFLQLSLNRRMIKKSFFTTRYYNNYSTVITTTITEEWLSATADITILRVLCFYLKTCINKQWINSSVINVIKSVNLKLV